MGRYFDDGIDRVAFRLALEETPAGGERIVWLKTIGPGEQRVYTREPHTSIWRRLWVALIGLLPVESQL